MKHPELDERFPIWDVLSEFFLDTELIEKDYDRIASVLADSDLSINEIQEILYYEVYPACIGNLFSIAGEWAGFHPEWIMENIAPRKDKRPKWSIGPICRWHFIFQWKKVTKLIEEKRKL